MTLIPYFLVAAYGLKLAWRGETYEVQAGQRRSALILAGLAVVYTAWLLFAAGMKYLLLSAVIYGPGTVLFYLARHEQHLRTFTSKERLAFAAASAAAVVAVWAIASGRIRI